MKIDAMCPKCLGKGCDDCKCGVTQFGFAVGDLWTMECRSCGWENGGSIVKDGQPAPLDGARVGYREADRYDLKQCPHCAGDMHWRRLGTTEECGLT